MTNASRVDLEALGGANVCLDICKKGILITYFFISLDTSKLSQL